MARPIPVPSILTLADVAAAFEATGLSGPWDAEAGIVEVARLNAAFHRLVAEQASSKAAPLEIAGTGHALKAMAAACRHALAPLAFRLKDMPEDTDPLAEFGHSLAATQDPSVIALLDACRAFQGPGDAEARLAFTLSMVRDLERWSGAAAQQFAAGAKAAQAKQQAEARQNSTIFGTAVIGAYERLCSRTPGISRRSPDKADAGAVTGPLIRFTGTIYARLRERCLALPDLVDLAAQRALNPKAETIASWQERVRAPS